MPEAMDLWALDLDGRGRPYRAHRIVRELGGERLTACGMKLTQWNHPRGWWTTRPGELPLTGTGAIHCGEAE